MSRDLGELGRSGGGPLLAGRSPEPPTSSPPISFGDYAPSPNTSSQAVNRANQLRVQNLLRRLLLEPNESVRIDTVRVLRRTLREIDFQLSWLTQVDFLETMERLLSSELQQARPNPTRDPQGDSNRQDSLEPETGPDSSWRLVHDATQLLIEAVGRLEHEIDQQLVEAIVPSVVENLGHPRSEVRRASLLLLNLLLNEKPGYFKLLMRLFIDYGLTNYRNKQAQRGSILSLPLLVSEPIVERGEDLTPLVRCLSELLLIDSNEQLFYSLYLAMQRIHMMIGDQQFQAILRHCEPEAAHLYRQAASRNNSLVLSAGSGMAEVAPETPGQRTRRLSSNASKAGQQQQLHQLQQQEAAAAQREAEQQQQHQQQQHQSRQHVTFEPTNDEANREDKCEEMRDVQEEQSDVAAQTDDRTGDLPTDGQRGLRSDSQLSTTTSESLSIGSSSANGNGQGPSQQPVARVAAGRRQFSSDVSSTCSSDAHLVNPAHYMTKAALQGHPMDHYEEIHHVDHSNITGLAINDFGPICNTPTIEFNPQLSAGIQTSLGQHLRASHQCESPAAAMALLSSELKFGIFPRHLIQVTLHSARASDRYEAMQELMCIIRESPINHLAILMTYFDSFLEQFLSKVLLGGRNSQQRQQQQQQPPPSDCKLELVAIDMIETIIIKTKVSTMQFIRPIVSLLMRALANDATQQATTSTSSGSQQDQQIQQLHQLHQMPSIFRENICRVVHKMMAYLPPQHVLDAIFEHKHQKSWLVREETINRVTAAILEYDRNEFNLTKLCYHVLPMLADQSASVRLASLECIATLAHVLGPERIGSLLTAAEAVQTGCDYDGLLDAINARLMRHTLPRCQSNGIVRYALKPLLAHHQFQTSGGQAAGERAPLAADVRWVLESPALHHHHHYHDHPGGAQEQGGSGLATENHHHHHHRLGVYSPPSQAERRRRRSSVGVVALESNDEKPAEHEHHHHHNHNNNNNRQQQQQHQHHQQLNHQHKSAARRSTSTSSGQQQRQADADRPAECPPSMGPKDCSSDQRARDTGDELDISENRRNEPHGGGTPSDGGQPVTQTDSGKTPPDRRRKSQGQVVTGGEGSAAAGRRRQSIKTTTASGVAGAQAACGRHGSVAVTGSEVRSQSQKPSCRNQNRNHNHYEQSNQQRQQPIRRSNSQDSLSSTDTNKVLFQFYLGKFKQSLADPSGNHYQAVLPSDSIIYTDINQAYEFSRHQSRFQQTSLEHEPERSEKTAGRHADGPSSASVAPQGTNLNKTISKTNHQETRAGPTSRKRSSLAQMNPSEGAGNGSGGHQPDGLQDAETAPTVPVDRRPSQEHQKHTRRGSISSQVLAKQQQLRDEEPNETSGSESPQTIREAHGLQRQSGQATKSRPLIQRQSTIGRSEQVSTADEQLQTSDDQRRRYSSPEQPAANKTRGSISSGGTNRRQSVVDGRGSPGFIEELGGQKTTDRGEHEPEKGAPSDQVAGESAAAETAAGFAAQRRRSQSISKQSSGGSQTTPPTGGATTTSEHHSEKTHRRQASGGSLGGSQRMPRQDSEATTVSSLASTSVASQVVGPEDGAAGEPELKNQADADEDDEDEQPGSRQETGERLARRSDKQGADDEAGQRRRSSSRGRRARSRPRTSGDRGGEEPSGQAAEREARRRASRSQPPVARLRNSDEAQHKQQQEPTSDHHPKAARLIKVRHQSNYATDQQHYYQKQQQQESHRRLGALGSDSNAVRASSVSPGLSNSVNIRHILENVAQLEGPFAEPQLALKVAMSALESACWSTKVEGLLALIRIAAHHPELMLAESHLHEIVARTADETRNLRSTVARAAIFALGDYCQRLKRSIEPEMDLIVKALLSKSIENTAFFRDDIRRALGAMVDQLTPWRLATLLVNQGAQHKSVHVRRMTSQFVALIVDRMGAAKALVGAREISHLLLPAAARFAQDQSPHTRYYGRLILSKLMHHSSFERLLRRNLTSTLYRSTIGVIESIKRRGCGAPPDEI